VLIRRQCLIIEGLAVGVRVRGGLVNEATQKRTGGWGKSPKMKDRGLREQRIERPSACLGEEYWTAFGDVQTVLEADCRTPP